MMTDIEKEIASLEKIQTIAIEAVQEAQEEVNLYCEDYTAVEEEALSRAKDNLKSIIGQLEELYRIQEEENS